MVSNMTLQNYLMIDLSVNTVENICLWDGNTETWQPPTGYLMLVQATTMALVWQWDKAIPDWVLTQQIGQGQIGFTWNGSECVTNDPKPEPPQPQPVTEGTQNL
jgi:hypothetical protein